ncbi:MAG: WbqC family protein [Chitinophagaceae bacterium]|nr:WbqC family protein [Chitinophagaceae bacterium]MBA4167797.1 WbqC family protein [Chitinophagaceae bacterium]
MILVTDLQYFAPDIYYNELNCFTYVILDQYDQYRKMSFRNRCTLSGSNGLINLSIPLIGGRDQKKEMKDVRIEYREGWQVRHWKTIESCYNRSPFFDHYKYELHQLYRKKFGFLQDWNLSCTQWICDKMSINTNLSISDAYVETFDSEKFVDSRNRITPVFLKNLKESYASYPQVFMDRFGFIPNLSILDKLFCDGNKL